MIDAHRDGRSAERSAAASLAASEDWHYRLDGRDHGPYKWGDLQELIRSSGETAARIVVRRADQSDWRPFSEVSGEPCAGHSEARASLSTGSSATAVPGSARAATAQRPTARMRPADKLDLAIAVAAFVLLNATLVLTGQTSERYATERQYYAALNAMRTEVDTLRINGGSEAQWAALSERFRPALEPIVGDLEQTADDSGPVRRRLLLAAWQLQIMTAPKDNRTENAARLYRNSMLIVKEELERP